MFMIDLGAESYYSMLGVSPDALVKEIRERRDAMIKELRKKQAQEKSEEERQKIEGRQKEINAIGEILVRPEKRKEYDRNNAHLRFFVIQAAASPMFVNKADKLYVLHRVVRDFLGRKGGDLAPLSDIDRDDFSADETKVPLLDSLLAEEIA